MVLGSRNIGFLLLAVLWLHMTPFVIGVRLPPIGHINTDEALASDTGSVLADWSAGGGGAEPDFSYPQLRPSTSDQQQESAVRELVYRLIPDRAAEFSFSVSAKLLDSAGRDLFTVRASSGHVHIEASTGVAASWGLHHYLKYGCAAHVSWDSDQLELPRPLPDFSATVRANDRFRYYQNVCTVSYSSVWWGWGRWQRELDWMALNGVNLALAFTGQEVIWRRVFTQIGLEAAEVDQFFTGPAFLAWNRMGNLQRWAGPLSDAWHADQLTLAHQIIARMRQLGITPVLPAFAGHVPQNFTRVFPKAPVSHLRCWGHMNSTYSCTSFLQPNSPLYQKIGQLTIQELEREFNGTEHVYNCDSFNEMTPPSSDPDYLAAAGNATLAAMTGADPQAVWLMQGWLFLNSFWEVPQAKAYLTSVPTGRMIVLDLHSDVKPLYGQLDSYYGQPFIWCMLHNFGGQLGLQGTVDQIVKGPFEGRAIANSSMVGTGLTMEGIFQNYVMYDLMLEMGWRKSSPDVVQWAADYSRRRYGPDISNHTTMADAWKFLITTVYNHTVNSVHFHGWFAAVKRPELVSSAPPTDVDTVLMSLDLGHIGYFMVTSRPQLSPFPALWYNSSDLTAAWDRLVAGATADQVRAAANLRHDLVDVTREVLTGLLTAYHGRLVGAFSDNNTVLLREEGAVILELLADLDTVLNTDKDFLLGAWVKQAREAASSEEEGVQFVYNLLNQLTLWGPRANIVDYAAKQWSGLMYDYYRARWRVFITYLEECLVMAQPYNQTEVNARYFSQVEEPFTFGPADYSHVPTGDTAEVVAEMYQKYRPALDGNHRRTAGYSVIFL
ncbi:alpha-N-acetylglucosaminidase-like isoform X2 [Amphibalanus amphitrite]|uniref:alpha-N-acetylglucosaminidase-like isoform X2 n=1 Tax=Amphibalanus amphitrite TaxID=1232801 RepID=UPI001C90F424|nr:alpha-N-acetylglucosaminidase-like isoform X2 [Amphibalanus amphitrite]